MSDKEAAFKYNRSRKKKFDTKFFREKDTVVSHGYEFLDSKRLEKLIGKHEN